MKIIIIGAGIAGAVAYGAMRSHKPYVFEAKVPGKTGYDSHKAILRIRDPSLGLLLGCGLEKVTIRKAVLYNDLLSEQSSITTNNLYSMKVYGSLGIRSMSSLGEAERYLLKGSPIAMESVCYGHKLVKITPGKATFHTYDEREVVEEYDFMISTIPLPHALATTNLSAPEDSFKADPIWVTIVPLKVGSSVHQTIYVPESRYSSYRVSLEGDRLIYESMLEEIDGLEKERLASHFGLFSEDLRYDKACVYKQTYGKLIPASDEIRKRAIYDLTSSYRVFSLGRFAIWKPIRTDHLISDIDRITKMMSVFSTKHNYCLNKEQV